MAPGTASEGLIWGAALRPYPGNTACGDGYLVRPLSDGVLLAVADGLGHGSWAEVAAQRALQTLERHAGEPLSELFHHCHRALRVTRGVVMSVAALSFSRASLEWFGVGNVEGLLLSDDGRIRDHVPLRGGVVGHTLPKVRPRPLALMPGDTLILATDGIGDDMTVACRPERSPQSMADRILADYAKDTDDALVLVARFAGPPV